MKDSEIYLKNCLLIHTCSTSSIMYSLVGQVGREFAFYSGDPWIKFRVWPYFRYRNVTSEYSEIYREQLTSEPFSCCRTAVGVGQRALSLSAHTAGGPPPPPGPGEGDVTTPYSRRIAGTTVGSLLRGTGGFNHPRESLNPSLHTGGPRRGRSFRRRLRQWCRWHGSRGVETTSYVNVRRRLWIPHSAATPTRGSIGYALRIWLRWYVKFRLFL